MMDTWLPIETAPTDGREIIGYEDGLIRVCYPKVFPRPLHPRPKDVDLDEWLRTPMAGDRWEYFRDDEHAPGHTWSMCPTHWMPLPEPPAEAQ